MNTGVRDLIKIQIEYNKKVKKYNGNFQVKFILGMQR